jgi:hypothetical protein
MKKSIFIAIILGFSIFASQGYCEINKSLVTDRKGPGLDKKSYHEIMDNKIRFIQRRYPPFNWKNRLEIDKLVKEMVKYITDCHIRGDWRWETLPENSRDIIVLAWYNIDTYETGWCAIKNTSDHWWVASDYHRWTTQKDFTQSKWEYSRDEMDFHWTNKGVNISIVFRNPRNENGWTKHDIWYQFN